MFNNTLYKLFGDSLMLTIRAIRQNDTEEFSRNNFQITPEQFFVLNLVYEKEGLSQNNLCETLGKDKANIARILNILDEKKLVTKHQSTQNGKSINSICVTELGRQMRNLIIPSFEKSRKDYLNDISEDDIHACIKVLSKIRSNLDRKTKKDGKKEQQKRI